MEDKFMKISEAAAYIGKQPQVLRRMVYDGILPRITMGGNHIVFRRSDLDRIKETRYVAGLSHADIAAKYGIGRTKVVYHFARLKVKSAGIYRGSNNANIYDLATVAKFAKILGWTEVRQEDKNPQDES